MYLDYQSCDWNSRFPSKILYTFPFSLRQRYTTLFPNNLPVLEKSKIKSLTVSFRHSLFHEENARPNNRQVLYILSLSQSSCSPNYSVLKAPSFHLLPILWVRLSVKCKGEVEMSLYSFFSLGARWGGSLTPPPGRFSPEMARFSVHVRAGGPQGRVWAGAKNLARTGIRSLDRPARSYSDPRDAVLSFKI